MHWHGAFPIAVIFPMPQSFFADPRNRIFKFIKWLFFSQPVSELYNALNTAIPLLVLQE